MAARPVTPLPSHRGVLRLSVLPSDRVALRRPVPLCLSLALILAAPTLTTRAARPMAPLPLALSPVLGPGFLAVVVAAPVLSLALRCISPSSSVDPELFGDMYKLLVFFFVFV